LTVCNIIYGIDNVNGAIVYKFDLPEEAIEFGFAEKGEKLICSSGEIYKLSNTAPTLVYKFEWE